MVDYSNELLSEYYRPILTQVMEIHWSWNNNQTLKDDVEMSLLVRVVPVYSNFILSCVCHLEVEVTEKDGIISPTLFAGAVALCSVVYHHTNKAWGVR
ncbi:hypothetical protein AgCh_000980 [Apium graveolens]